MTNESEDNRISEHGMERVRSNRPIVIACLVFVGCMVGAAYAAVPLYQLFCQVTGFGGTPRAVQSIDVEPIDRRIAVSFDANVGGDLAWEFKPVKRKVTLQMGEVAQVEYIARNFGSESSSGVATFNVVPFEAGVYFNKLDCFCFLDQKLEPQESMEMPVVFFVDPDMNNDPDLKHVKEITLSYTFFPGRSFESSSNRSETESIELTQSMENR